MSAGPFFYLHIFHKWNIIEKQSWSQAYESRRAAEGGDIDAEARNFRPFELSGHDGI